MKCSFFIVTVFLLLYSPCSNAQVKTDIPPLQVSQYRQMFWDTLTQRVSRVTDFAILFSTDQQHELNNMINDFEKQNTVELAILTLDTFCVAENRFDSLSLRFARYWAVGKNTNNNGVLICICPGYRKIRIENSYGIMQYLSNAETKQLIDEQFIPRFKEGDYFSGTRNGLASLMYLLKSRSVP